MAAPSGTVWGTAINDYSRLGLYVTTTSNATTVFVTAQVWFWSKYSVNDSVNNFFFDWDTTSAVTNMGSVSINTYNDSGAGWSTANQVLIVSYDYSYKRESWAMTGHCAAALNVIEASPGTMNVTASFNIPALQSYTVSYNANGGSGAPGNQTKYYGQTLKLSSTKPTRPGYGFVGWGTSSTAQTPSYQPGDNYTANASTTLYAIWSLIELVSFAQNGSASTDVTYTISGGSIVGTPSETDISINVDYTSSNANTNIYYRVCYADTSSGTLFDPELNAIDGIIGPTTASTLGSIASITISSDLIKHAIIAQQNNDTAVFVIQVSNTNNIFSSELTTSCIVTIDINNFRLLDGELYAAYWDQESPARMRIKVEFVFPINSNINSSYIPIIKNSKTDTEFNVFCYDGTVTTDSDRKRIMYDLSITNFDTDCFAVIEVTDGLSTGKVYFRIVPYSFDQSITIDKENKRIGAVEFIEHSKLYGFQRGGRVYFPSFSEVENGNIGITASSLMMYDMYER